MSIYKYWKSIFASLVFISSSLFANCATGQQLKVDNTLGEESSAFDSGVIINETPSDLIKGGALRGSNLFHSFELFNVDEGHGVYFDINNRPGVARIISRVTGSSSSEIMGVLGVNGGNADLFLINPNGILFGPNASLDLNGSFLASTASSVIFSDTQYSAAEPSSFPLLSMNIPTGLSFRNIPASIVNQSQVFDPDEGETIGLQVKSGKTLTFVGGDIRLESGFLTAPNGRINIASLERTGEVALDASSFAIDFKREQNFGNIQLLEGSIISTAGTGSGDVNLQGKNIEFTGGSAIDALSFGSEPGGTIRITASEDVLLEGTDSFGSPSFLLAGTAGSGEGGNIAIRANKLVLRDRARIQASSTFFRLNSGEVISATGQAGSVTIAVRDLEVSGGSRISAATSGMAMGGDVIINASDSINISGLSEVSTQSSSRNLLVNGGAAGDITFNTKFLQVSNGSTVAVNSEGAGKAGNLKVNAQSILLKDQGSLNANTLGGSGNIEINAENIILRTSGSITTDATGIASGGNIYIDTGALIALENSDITANSQERFGGQVVITAKGIFGTQFREKLTLQSDITATSELGPDFSGIVELNTPDVDPSKGLVELPTTVVDPNSLVAQSPCRRGSRSEFTRSGKGGLPPSIGQDFNSDATQVALVTPASTSLDKQQTKPLTRAAESTTSALGSESPVVPAQGWVFNNKGEVVLVADNAVVVGPQRLKTNPAGCPLP
jgi:filamentous hemagglutinin family protein